MKTLLFTLLSFSFPIYSHVLFYEGTSTYLYEAQFVLVGCNDGYVRGYYIGIEEDWYGQDWEKEENLNHLVATAQPLRTDSAYVIFGSEMLDFFSYSPDRYNDDDYALTGQIHDGIFPRIKKDRSCHHNSFGYI